MKSNKIKSVERKIKFPNSSKIMYIPNTKQSKKSAVVRRHLKNGSWEKHISKILYDNAKPNTNVIDIGAFIGTHTLALADISSKGNGKVYSFEPQTWAYNLIKSSIKLSYSRQYQLSQVLNSRPRCRIIRNIKMSERR